MEGSILRAAQGRPAIDVSAEPRYRFIEPPMLGLAFLVLDAALFALPGLFLAGHRGLLAAGALTTSQTGLALCLGAAFFFAAISVLPSWRPTARRR